MSEEAAWTTTWTFSGITYSAKEWDDKQQRDRIEALLARIVQLLEHHWMPLPPPPSLTQEEEG